MRCRRLPCSGTDVLHSRPTARETRDSAVVRPATRGGGPCRGDLVRRAGYLAWHILTPEERCESGRIGLTANELTRETGSEGSNPSLSARSCSADLPCSAARGAVGYAGSSPGGAGDPSELRSGERVGGDGFGEMLGQLVGRSGRVGPSAEGLGDAAGHPRSAVRSASVRSRLGLLPGTPAPQPGDTGKPGGAQPVSCAVGSAAAIPTRDATWTAVAPSTRRHPSR